MKRKIFKPMAILCVAASLTFACNKEAGVVLTQEMQEDVLATPQNETFVSISKATDIATAFFGTRTDSPVTKSNARIASTETIRDSKNNNDPMMYVMNYANGGFAIVGATKNYYPILAYSDENNFVYNEEIGGLVIWMEETQEAIRQSETLDADTKAAIRSSWSRYDPVSNTVSTPIKTKVFDPVREAAFQARKTTLMNQSGGTNYTYYRLSEAGAQVGYDFSYLYGECEIPGDEDYSIVGVKIDYTRHVAGPFVSTQWHQKSPFNDLISGYAGCGTIAVAQIMKFHEYPSYNWSNMPDIGATSDTKALIKDVHSKIGSSGTPEEARAALQYFGYNTTLVNHDAQSAANEIIGKQRPISMGGFTNSFLGKPTGDGHRWVCDGADRTLYTLTVFVEFLMGTPGNFYYTSHNHPSFYYPEVVHSYIPSFYFHMNWGWGPLSSTPNAWYVHNNVSTNAGNFSHLRKDIYASK